MKASEQKQAIEVAERFCELFYRVAGSKLVKNLKPPEGVDEESWKDGLEVGCSCFVKDLSDIPIEMINEAFFGLDKPEDEG